MILLSFLCAVADGVVAVCRRDPPKMWAIYFYYLRDNLVGINDHSGNVTSPRLCAFVFLRKNNFVEEIKKRIFA